MNTHDQSDAPEMPHTLPEPLPPDPFPLVLDWLSEAVSKRRQPNPNAMTLATVDADGSPSARTVLCKHIDAKQGFLVFYTNYHSRKARALDAHPRAALLFHWDAFDRQIRVEGRVTRSPTAESDAYYASRPLNSRLGAWASDQSEPIASREQLVAKLADVRRRFGLDPESSGNDPANLVIPRPPHWGGFRIWAERVECWLGSTGRLHDRAIWTRKLQSRPDGWAGDPWASTRLQP